MGISEEKQKKLAYVARRYYLDNWKQSDIAKELGVSRPLVSRMLAEAREHGVVDRQQAELLERAAQIVRLNQGMVEALSAAIEFRNGESGQHVRRIHDITRYLLTHTELGDGLSQTDVDNIALAAIMHDAGKIAIPDAILSKPGKLTKEEFEIMKTHTVQGAALLEKIPQMQESGAYLYACDIDAILSKPGKLTKEEFEIMKTHTVQGAALLEKIPQMQESGAYLYACDIARHHHERWDGRGYPDGLKGDEISIWSQVVSLADVYDALTRKRVCKDAFSCEEALRMIRDGECGAFNPELLEAFFAVEPALRELCHMS